MDLDLTKSIVQKTNSYFPIVVFAYLLDKLNVPEYLFLLGFSTITGGVFEYVLMPYFKNRVDMKKASDLMHKKGAQALVDSLCSSFSKEVANFSKMVILSNALFMCLRPLLTIYSILRLSYFTEYLFADYLLCLGILGLFSNSAWFIPNFIIQRNRLYKSTKERVLKSLH